MLKPYERAFWVALPRAWSGWRSCLLVVKPATVIASHRRVDRVFGGRTNPSLAWVEQQLREATAWGETPRFLLHDNDGIFGQLRERQRCVHKGLRYRLRLDVWLADAMGIEGLPIP